MADNKKIKEHREKASFYLKSADLCLRKAIGGEFEWDSACFQLCKQLEWFCDNMALAHSKHQRIRDAFLVRASAFGKLANLYKKDDKHG